MLACDLYCFSNIFYSSCGADYGLVCRLYCFVEFKQASSLCEVFYVFFMVVSLFASWRIVLRSEEHTSELQSHSDLVCRLLLEKKKKKTKILTYRCKRHEYKGTCYLQLCG